MSDTIKRATGLLVIEVVNSNPNGDPDRESDPRQRPDGCGEISPVSFKRKLRDLLDDHDAPFFQALPEKFRAYAERCFILEHRGRDRKEIKKEMGEVAHFMQGKVDGAGAVRRGRGQSPFSAPPDVVGSIFFCQQKFHSVAQTWCHVFVNYEHGTMLANVVYYH